MIGIYLDALETIVILIRRSFIYRYFRWHFFHLALFWSVVAILKKRSNGNDSAILNNAILWSDILSRAFQQTNCRYRIKILRKSALERPDPIIIMEKNKTLKN